MNPSNLPPLHRRDFIRQGSLATLGMLVGAVEITGQSPEKPAATAPAGPPVACGLIGAGFWGRDILAALARVSGARVAAVCETYPAYLRRAQQAAPDAVAFEDYRALLDDTTIPAVIVATPTHQHREIVEAALQAGKHVYCEAPLAATVEDARAIALAAKRTSGQVFQAGLQTRAEPQHHHVLGFLRAGAIGQPLMARSQWNKKNSWRRASPNRDRERELNWRLDSAVSTGLAGEVGIHQMDVASWFLLERPVSVTGFGGVLHWNDGREVADTIHTVLEYPRGITLNYSATLANSFQSDCDIYYGTDSAVMIQGNRAWMFKEADAPLLGWEVYARKDAFYTESGIALVADATKLLAQGLDPASNAQEGESALYYALEDFVGCIREGRAPKAGADEGYAATLVALKANEAVRAGKKISIDQSWFDLG